MEEPRVSAVALVTGAIIPEGSEAEIRVALQTSSYTFGLNEQANLPARRIGKKAHFAIHIRL